MTSFEPATAQRVVHPNPCADAASGDPVRSASSHTAANRSPRLRALRPRLRAFHHAPEPAAKLAAPGAGRTSSRSLPKSRSTPIQTSGNWHPQHHWTIWPGVAAMSSRIRDLVRDHSGSGPPSIPSHLPAAEIQDRPSPGMPDPRFRAATGWCTTSAVAHRFRARTGERGFRILAGGGLGEPR